MNGRRSVLVVAGAALAGLVAIGPALAGADGMGRPHGGHGGPGGRMMATLSRLNLSEDQKSQVQSILADEHPKMQPLASASRSARSDLAQAIHAPSLDEHAIRAAATRLGAAEADLAVERARLGLRIRAVLTPAQQKQLDDMRQLAQDRMQQRREEWQKGGSQAATPDTQDPDGEEDTP